MSDIWKVNDPICIISPHPKGFWQADVYFQGWEDGLSCDWFCTSAVGATKQNIIDKVTDAHGDIEIVDGVTGLCHDCCEEYFELEDVCLECDQPLSET